MKLRGRKRERAMRTGFCDGCGSVCDETCRAERRIEDARLWAMTGGAWRLR